MVEEEGIVGACLRSLALHETNNGEVKIASWIMVSYLFRITNGQITGVIKIDAVASNIDKSNVVDYLV